MVLAVSGAALGQGLTGSIVGTVTDPANMVVPRVKITVRNVNTNSETETTTDPDGIFRAVGLVPGEYTVSAEASGFRRLTTSPQTVGVATPVHLDLNLEVGKSTEIVSVETRATQVNTE